MTVETGILRVGAGRRPRPLPLQRPHSRSTLHVLAKTLGHVCSPRASARPNGWRRTSPTTVSPRRPSKEREAPGVFPPARSNQPLVSARPARCLRRCCCVGTTSAADRLWYTRRSWPSFRALPATPMSTHDVGGHLRTFRANRRRPPCARPASGGTSALAMLVTRCRSLARSRPSEPGAQ